MRPSSFGRSSQQPDNQGMRIMLRTSRYTIVACVLLLLWCASRSTNKFNKPSELRTTASSKESLPSIASFVKPLPVNISYYGKHFSQDHQDEAVDKILNGMTGGFFVESGAYDGVGLSNSLYFEASKGWQGLLIEANPYLYQKIVSSSGRNATVIHACVSPSKTPEVLPFRLAGPIGGIVSGLSTGHKDRIQNEISSGKPWMAGGEGSGLDVPVSCWPLQAMLSVLGIGRVDFWSLDTEGSEAAILAATNFDALDIRVILVEVNDVEAEAKVKDVMARRPEYTLHSRVGLDMLFVKSAT